MSNDRLPSREGRSMSPEEDAETEYCVSLDNFESIRTGMIVDTEKKPIASSSR